TKGWAPSCARKADPLEALMNSRYCGSNRRWNGTLPTPVADRMATLTVKYCPFGTLRNAGLRKTVAGPVASVGLGSGVTAVADAGGGVGWGAGCGVGAAWAGVGPGAGAGATTPAAP